MPQPPALTLLSSSSPAHPISTSPSYLHTQSQSPFRYINFDDQHSQSQYNEKDTPLTEIAPSSSSSSNPPYFGRPSSSHPHSPLRSSTAAPKSHHAHRSGRSQHHTSRAPSYSQLLHPSSSQSQQYIPFSHAHQHSYHRPRGLRIWNLLKSWLPIILYIFTSLVFVVAIAAYKTELFSLLDELAHWLQIDEEFGHAALFGLIFLTTFPPIPLYSTLIILSGYTFGLWTGAIISYFAALSGALTVFILSRLFFRDCISGWLASTPTIRRVVRAIEKRPKLLFLIRLAPYPYNVMNCLLAASPSLTLRTYTICTALSLFKVVIHTGLGASIHSFKDYHTRPKNPGTPGEESSADTVARMSTIGGIFLCVAILVYISVVARRVVNDELDDDESTAFQDSEERQAFLGDVDLESGSMTESPFRTHQLMPNHPSTPGVIRGEGY